MKSLAEYSKNILESRKTDILAYKYNMFPYEWEEFAKLSKEYLGINHTIDDGDEIVYNEKSKTVIARFDYDENIIYTSIPKDVIFKAVLHKNKRDLRIYMTENAILEDWVLSISNDDDVDKAMKILDTSKIMYDTYMSDDMLLFNDKKSYEKAQKLMTKNNVDFYTERVNENLKLGDEVQIKSGKHANKKGTVEMILKSSVVVDIDAAKSSEEDINNVVKLS